MPGVLGTPRGHHGDMSPALQLAGQALQAGKAVFGKKKRPFWPQIWLPFAAHLCACVCLGMCSPGGELGAHRRGISESISPSTRLVCVMTCLQLCCTPPALLGKMQKPRFQPKSLGRFGRHSPGAGQELGCREGKLRGAAPNQPTAMGFGGASPASRLISDAAAPLGALAGPAMPGC